MKNKLKLISYLIASAYFLILQPVMAAESGSALKNDTLRKEPYADAKTTGSISRGEPVQIIKKQGAWLEIKTKKSAGWVRLLSVKRGSTTSGNQAAGVLAAASGRAGTGQVVSTTGVRGLSEDELKAAKFNEAEIKTMESFTLSADDGAKFAKAADLHTVKFANLKAPKGETK